MKHITAVTYAEIEPESQHPPPAVEPENHPGEWRMTGCACIPVSAGKVELAWYWQRPTEG